MSENLLPRHCKRCAGINTELLEALKGLSDMYGHAWDLVEGGLIMMEPSISKFEAAHAKAQRVIDKAKKVEGSK